MATPPVTSSVLKTAVNPYNPTPPHVSIRSHVTDEVFRRSLEVTKFEARHFGPRRLYQVLPPLIGPHSIGHASFIIEGPQKTCSVGDSIIGIEIYAPINKVSGNRRLLELNPDQGLDAEQIQTLYTHSLDHLDGLRKMPVLIFSHGLDVNPIEYRLLLEEVASHGYVVLNLNHPSSSGYAPFSQEALDSRAIDHMELFQHKKFLMEMEKLASAQASNIRFVIDQIRNGKLKNLGLMDQIVLAGHSLGGTASIMASRTVPHIAGCINLDGSLKGDEATRADGLGTPVLMLLHDQTPHLLKAGDEGFEEQQQILQDWETFHDKSNKSTQVTIGDINHMDFCATPILKWLIGKNTLVGALKAHIIASREILGFMRSPSLSKKGIYYQLSFNSLRTIFLLEKPPIDPNVYVIP